MTLKSQKAGNVLKVFLCAVLTAMGINFVLTIFYLFNYDFYLRSIMEFDQSVSVFFYVTYLMLIVIYTIWIFRVHMDLKHLNPDYEVSPWGAIARIFIPFYWIYGMWNLFSTMSRYFKEQQTTNRLGSKLNVLIPFYYFPYFIGTIVYYNMVIAFLKFDEPLIPVYPIVILILYALDFMLYISYLLIVIFVTKALNALRTEMEETVTTMDDDKQDIYIDSSGIPRVNV